MIIPKPEPNTTRTNMILRCLILSSSLQFFSVAGQPAKLPKDATRIDITPKDNSYNRIYSINNKKITVNFLISRVKPGMRDSSIDYGLGMTPSDISSNNINIAKIEKLQIEWSTRKLTIPNTAYSQLYNFKYIYITEIKNLLLVRILGGDGGDSYVCDLYFNKNNLTKKEIYSMEFPDEANEITTYKYNDSTN